MTLAGPANLAFTLAGGVWAWSFARPEAGTVAIALAVLVAASLALARRWPAISGMAITATILIGRFALDVPGDNPWPLAGVLIAAYALGRYGAISATAPALVAMWGALASLDPSLPGALFAGVLVGAPWALGRVLRHRWSQAARAAEAAAALAVVDPAVRAQQAVAEERARLAADVLAVIRSAVLRMQVSAAQAEQDLDPGALAVIQEQGRQATAELRRMLGLLRSEDLQPETPAASVGDASARRPWRADALVAVTVAGLYALETQAGVTARELSWQVPAVGASLGLLGALALRRTHLAAAAALGTLTPVTALLLDLPVSYGLWSGVAAGLLVATIAAGRDRLAWAALGPLVPTLLWDVIRHDPDNAAIMMATLVLAGIVGYGWGDRTRAQQAAEAASAALRADHDAVAESARRADRLRIARELHDVTSHGIGVMVLQAGAAAALREHDPARAREAIGIIRSVAAESLAQVDSLFELLDAGTIGAAGLASAAPAADLREAVATLADRGRQAGLRVTVNVGTVSTQDPAVLATAYRIVQEALTNAMRHAPGSAVQVRVRQGAGGLEVSVSDDGAPAGANGTRTGGFGLVGLVERVTALGGEIRTGPRPGRGFEVRAVLPAGQPAEIRT